MNDCDIVVKVLKKNNVFVLFLRTMNDHIESPPNAKEFCLKPFENRIDDNDKNTNTRQKFYISCSMLRVDMQTVYYNNPIS